MGAGKVEQGSGWLRFAPARGVVARRGFLQCGEGRSTLAGGCARLERRLRPAGCWQVEGGKKTSLWAMVGWSMRDISSSLGVGCEIFRFCATVVKPRPNPVLFESRLVP